MDWTPNDIVLSIQAYLDRRADPDGADRTIKRLAADTRRSYSAAKAGMDAIGIVDPDLENGPGLTPFAEVVARHLWSHPRELRHLVRAIRNRET